MVTDEFFTLTKEKQMIAVAHELGHAQEWRMLVEWFTQAGSNWEEAHRFYRQLVPGRGSAIYALHEMTVESRAVEAIAKHLGGISPEAQAWSRQYILNQLKQVR